MAGEYIMKKVKDQLWQLIEDATEEGASNEEITDLLLAQAGHYMRIMIPEGKVRASRVIRGMETFCTCADMRKLLNGSD